MLKNKKMIPVDEKGDSLPDLIVYSPIGSADTYGIVKIDDISIILNDDNQIKVSEEYLNNIAGLGVEVTREIIRLDGRIDAERSRSISQEDRLQNVIDAEIARSKAEDTKLSNDILDIINNTTLIESTLTDKISTETVRNNNQDVLITEQSTRVRRLELNTPEFLGIISTYTDDITDTALTTRADELIASWPESERRLLRANDTIGDIGYDGTTSMLWTYTSGGTWINRGGGAVTPATNLREGIVKGSLDNNKVKITPSIAGDAELEVNDIDLYKITGLNDELNNRYTIDESYNRSEVADLITRKINDIDLSDKYTNTAFIKTIDIEANVSYVILEGEHKQAAAYCLFIDGSGYPIWPEWYTVGNDIVIRSAIALNNLTIFIGIGLSTRPSTGDVFTLENNEFFGDNIFNKYPTVNTIDLPTLGNQLVTKNYVDGVSKLNKSNIISINGLTGRVILTPDNIGLSKVQNIAPLDMPISNAVLERLDDIKLNANIKLKADIIDLSLEISRATEAEKKLHNLIKNNNIKVHSTMCSNIREFIKTSDILNEVSNNDIVITADGICNIYTDMIGKKDNITSWVPFSLNINLNNYVTKLELTQELSKKADLDFVMKEIKRYMEK